MTQGENVIVISKMEVPESRGEDCHAAKRDGDGDVTDCVTRAMSLPLDPHH